MPAYDLSNPDHQREMVLAQPDARRRALVLKQIAKIRSEDEARAVLKSIRETCGNVVADEIGRNLIQLKRAEELEKQRPVRKFA